ncbi:putative reverse transcriptase domain-containing protein [Tanacetum coccineum]
MELHDVSYGINSVARPLLLFFFSENRLLWFRYREYDLAHLKLVFEFCIYRVWKSVRYGVSKELDTAYWGFLGVGTTFDIFQNIRILYLQYDVLSFSGYGVLSFIPLWSLFLGHVSNGDGLHVDSNKIEVVKNWEAPRTPSEALKDKLCNAPVLALLDGSEDFVVYCNVSGLGLGCVLMQRRKKELNMRQRRWIELFSDYDCEIRYHPGDHVLLKVSPCKGVVRFGKKGKLVPRYVGPFEITERISPVAYKLILPQELNGVHDTFQVSNLKKCLADPTLQIPLDEIQVNAKLNFVEEPVEILEREFKDLKWSRIAIDKVRWKSKRGPKFT